MFSFSKKQSISTDPGLIKSILTRGVEDVFVKESLEKKLRSGLPLRIKLGFDPTGSRIHIGRAIVLRKLREFQNLGHTVVFIVGDFTATIGDPSDKLEKRPMLTREVIVENLKTYKEQVGKIIDVSRAEFHYNATWLSKLGFKEIAELAESFSVLQMSNRRNFKERLDKGEEVSLREFLYPLMQGYDSVAVRADVELGGFDQLFNLKAGRVVQRHFKMKEQEILTTSMLPGTDGRKMSTSWGNVINITDEAGDMFGKIMSIKDELIPSYFLLCTDVSQDEIDTITQALTNSSINPRDLKVRLAKEIVSLYHNKTKAEQAYENFISVFQKGASPEDVMEIKAVRGASLGDVLAEAGILKSKSEFKRLIIEGAVSNAQTHEKITDIFHTLESSTIYKIGKHRFVKITIS